MWVDGRAVGRSGALSLGMDATGGTGWERQGAGRKEGVTGAEATSKRTESLGA